MFANFGHFINIIVFTKMEETLNTKFNFVFQLLLCTITSSSAGEKLPLTHIMMEIKTS